jgi:hypothetical protein
MSAEHYIGMAIAYRDHMNFRRLLEIKVTFGLWVAVGVATLFLSGRIEPGLPAMAYLLIWVVYAILWLRYNIRADKIDQKVMLFYFRNAEEILLYRRAAVIGWMPPYKKLCRELRWQFLISWVWWSHALTTACVFWVSYAVLTRQPSTGVPMLFPLWFPVPVPVISN